MRIQRTFQGGTSQYVAKKGTISADRKPGTLIWQRDGGRVYVTCRGCNAINDITNHQNRNYQNFLEPSCFVCTNCLSHYYFTLQDWEQPEFIRCTTCLRQHNYVIGKGEVRRLRKQGWAIDLNNKHGVRCPDCRKQLNRRP